MKPHPQIVTAPASASQPVPAREEVVGGGIKWVARWSARWVWIALGAVVLGWIVKETWVILFPVLMGLIIATVLSPVSTFLHAKAKFPRALAAGTTLLGAIALVVGAGFTIAPSVADQAGSLVSQASDGIQEIQDWVQNSDFVSKETIDNGLQQMQERLRGQAGSIAGGVVTGVKNITSAVITLVVSLILTFLFLKDGHRFLPWLRRCAGPRAGRHLEEVGHRSWATLGGFIRTQALVSFIDAVFIGIGLLLIGVPLAIPLALFTFFGGFIPIVGAFAAGGLAVLVALVSNGPTAALLVLALVVAVQQLEGNVLSPWLQSKSMDLHAAVVLLSVTLGGTLFGITGAFLAVPVVAIAAVALRYLDEVVNVVTTPEGAAETDGPLDEDELSHDQSEEPASS